MRKRFQIILVALAVFGAGGARRAEALTNVLFDFESGSVSGWSCWSYDSAVWADGSNPHSGSYALGYRHCEGESRYATAWSASPVADWTNYNRISCWARADAATGLNTLKLKITESSGEEWIQKVGTVLSTGYQRVEAVLDRFDANGFEVASGVNWTLELGSIATVTLVFDAQSTHSPYYINYAVDDIQIAYQPPVQAAELSASPDHVGFGLLQASPADHRFQSTNAATVSYTVSGYSSWSIEIYSSHPQGVAGLVGLADTNYTIPLRCWWGGPGGSPPDPEPNSSWTNYWSYVTRAADAWHPTLADQDNPMPANFNVYFATDPSGVRTQAYAAPVTIELKVQ